MNEPRQEAIVQYFESGTVSGPGGWQVHLYAWWLGLRQDIAVGVTVFVAVYSARQFSRSFGYARVRPLVTATGDGAYVLSGGIIIAMLAVYRWPGARGPYSAGTGRSQPGCHAGGTHTVAWAPETLVHDCQTSAVTHVSGYNPGGH